MRSLHSAIRRVARALHCRCTVTARRGRARASLDLPAPGLSVLEVLIASMLLSVIALTIFTSFAVGLRAATLAGGMGTAVSLADESLVAAAVDPCAAPVDEGNPPSPAYTRYERQLALIPRDGRDWELAVEVRWVESRRQHSVALVTYRHIPAACALFGP